MIVHIAVNLDLGWDNIVGVYDTYEKAQDACRPSAADLAGDHADWHLEGVDPNTGMYEMHHIHSKGVK